MQVERQMRGKHAQSFTTATALHIRKDMSSLFGSGHRLLLVLSICLLLLATDVAGFNDFSMRSDEEQRPLQPTSTSTTLAAVASPGEVFFSPNDLELIGLFIKHLKHLNGDWSKNGIQRVIRLNSACSHNYASLRSSRIRADVPIDEAFKDPYTLIEMQIYRKFSTLKSKETGKYVCYDAHSGSFALKSLSELDKYCIFMFKVKSLNQYKFSIGSSPLLDMSSTPAPRNINFSFNKFGRLTNYVNLKENNYECSNDESNLFYVHTKLTDIVIDRFVPIFDADKTTSKSSTSTSTTSTTTTTTTTTSTSTTTSTTTTAPTTTTTTKAENNLARKYLIQTRPFQFPRRNASLSLAPSLDLVSTAGVNTMRHRHHNRQHHQGRKRVNVSGLGSSVYSLEQRPRFISGSQQPETPAPDSRPQIVQKKVKKNRLRRKHKINATGESLNAAASGALQKPTAVRHHRKSHRFGQRQAPGERKRETPKRRKFVTKARTTSEDDYVRPTVDTENLFYKLKHQRRL